MEEFIPAVKEYFTAKVWSNMDHQKQNEYARHFYIYHHCCNLGIDVVVPNFMLRTTKECYLVETNKNSIKFPSVNNQITKKTWEKFVSVTFKCYECNFESSCRETMEQHMFKHSNTPPVIVRPKKRKEMSLREKQETLEKYDAMPKMNQRKAAQILNISQPTLCNLIKNREMIVNAQSSNHNLLCKRRRSGKHENVEKALKDWFMANPEKNMELSAPKLCKKANEIAKIMGIDFKASSSWSYRWKRRNNIGNFKKDK